MMRSAKKILILSGILITVPSYAQTSDEKLLSMLKQMNQPKSAIPSPLAPPAANGQPLPLLPPLVAASPMQQKLAETSEKYEIANKQTEMLGARVQGDLAFEQKLPRAVGYSKIGDKTSGVIDFSGKRFRLSVGDVFAGWTIASIDKFGIQMRSKNGYSFKSYFDIKQ